MPSCLFKGLNGLPYLDVLCKCPSGSTIDSSQGCASLINTRRAFASVARGATIGVFRKYKPESIFCHRISFFRSARWIIIPFPVSHWAWFSCSLCCSCGNREKGSRRRHLAVGAAKFRRRHVIRRRRRRQIVAKR